MSPTLALFLLAAAAPSRAEPAAPRAAESALASRCRNGVLDAAALAADRAALASADAESLGALAGVLACRSLAGAGPGCSALDGPGGAASEAASRCRSLAFEARFVRAALSGADAAALCRGEFSGKAPAEALGKACASSAAAARTGETSAACADLRAAGLSGGDAASCRAKLSYLGGKAAGCAALRDEAERADCRQLAQLVRGTRRPGDCAASPFCRALAGDAAGCGPLESALSRAACGASEKRRQAEREEARRKERADAAREEMKRGEERRKQAAEAAKARVEAARKPQFEKGQPMKSAEDVRAIMKRIEKGLPPPAKSARGEGEEHHEEQDGR